jgi:predicted transcriptional regulator
MDHHPQTKETTGMSTRLERKVPAVLALMAEYEWVHVLTLCRQIPGLGFGHAYRILYRLTASGVVERRRETPEEAGGHPARVVYRLVRP